MIRNFITILFCLVSGQFLVAQTREIDSLKNIINTKTNDRTAVLTAYYKLVQCFEDRNEFDSSRFYTLVLINLAPKSSDTSSIDTANVMLLVTLGGAYMFHKLDSAILLSTQALEWARLIKYQRGEAIASATLGENYRTNGNYPQALTYLLNALKISRELNDGETETGSLLFIGIAYSDLGAYRTGLDYMLQGMARHSISYSTMTPFMLSNIGDAYEKLNLFDSARYMQEKAAYMADSMKMGALKSLILRRLGVIHSRLGKPEKAIEYFHEAMRIQDYLNLGVAQYQLAELFHSLQQNDSSLYYARLGLINCQKSSQKFWVLEVSRLLVKLFEDRNMTDSAFQYQSHVLALRDSLFSPQKFNGLQLAAINEQQYKNEILQRQKETEQEKEKLANRIKVYGLLAVLAVFLLIALILFRNNRQKQMANALLQRQKYEIAQALTDLKTTQSQLIQSEKMASLGELTAGIAHEIQNPLNFVNNFSEVNKELIDELKGERLKAEGERNKDLEDQLLSNLDQNLEKINQHGKRADSIVKGMLQHSRTSSGQKEPTDINALADEYLRLSYHGMRAKDKTFNAALQTDFEKGLDKISIIPQDIGRVMVNLYNNAFQSMLEKAKLNHSGYEPTISVSTKKMEGKINITVRDNGTGIPEKIKDKIFQPFFTTKPTGQGTGLGLSLSYDIVKAHGGEINVESKEGEGSEFVVQLPV